MTDTTQISEAEAIRQAIADSTTMDYVDIVNDVKSRFRMDVTAADVEQVYRDLVNKKQSRTSFSLAAAPIPTDTAMKTSSTKSETSGQPKSGQPELQLDDITQALQFVKSMGGLSKAKRALADLESIMGEDLS